MKLVVHRIKKKQGEEQKSETETGKKTGHKTESKREREPMLYRQSTFLALLTLY